MILIPYKDFQWVYVKVSGNCWLLNSTLWFSFHLRYLYVITSNLTCLIVVILINCSVFILWRFKNFVSTLSLVFVLPQYYFVSWIMGFMEFNRNTWFKNPEDCNLNKHCSESLASHRYFLIGNIGYCWYVISLVRVC